MLPDEWEHWAISDRKWPHDTVTTEACKFADYWRGKSGKDATKLDWFATWRNWCRNARVSPQQARASPQTFRERDADLAAARVAEMTGGLVSAKHSTLFPIDYAPAIGMD